MLDELSSEQEEAYLEFVLLLRRTLGEIDNLQSRLSLITTLWTERVQAIHNEVRPSTIIPDNTGYPNAEPLSRGDITSGVNLLSALVALQTIDTTRRAVLAVGPTRIIGAAEAGKRRPRART